MTNNWVFVFALVDGRFCENAGLDKVISSLAASYASKIEFVVNLESVFSAKLSGIFGQRIKRDSKFAKFIMCLIDALKSAGIGFDTSLGEEEFFSKHLMQSITIRNDDIDDFSRITDLDPDVDRGNAIAWAVSEALLRTMYEADNSATMIDRLNVDCGHWSRIMSKVPRMSAFRDPLFAQSIVQWLRKFATVSVDEWTSQKCLVPYSATNAALVLYTRTNVAVFGGLFAAALALGFAVFGLTGGLVQIKAILRIK
jgi:hypothetical protein